jgi:hypothetical protein
MRPILTTALILLAAATAQASSPQLRALKPLGGQRGTEVEVTFSGGRLKDAQELMFYQPGITVAKLEAVDDATVKATLRIAPDCALGLHEFRLRTATGLSQVRSFSVGALKELTETEPNNDFAQPQAIAMNSTVNGIADNEDVDYYVVEARKGERITAEVEGIRLGVSLFDPYVAILDRKRFELASSDDAALVWQDGEASLIAPEDGKYIIQVRESAYAGNNQCTYRLHVGNFPRPTAVVPGGGKLGEAVEVKWIGDVAGEKTSKVTLPARPERNFGLFAEDEQGIAPYPNQFRLSTFGNVVEVEPNDDQATATPFDAPLALNGVIGKPGDVDHFVFKASKGQTFDVKVFARGLRSPLDSVLYVGPKGGGAMAGNDDSGGPDSAIRFTAPKDGEYVVWIVDHLRKGGPDYAYRIELSPVEPKLTMSVPNESLRRGTGAVAVTVPKGNRQAILVNATRSDFGGVLAVSASGLPAGVTMEADTMAANLGTYPVLFHASADAPVAGALATIEGKPVDTSRNLTSEFSHTIEMVLGQNNNPFWTRNLDHLAVAVAEEAPFSIEIVEPKVPLVRGGSMGLKVVAKRQEGFKVPIAVSLPWNPPGVGSAGGITIPEGQNEAIIPINANGGAELKTWKIVVNATADDPSNPPPTNPTNGRRGRRGGQFTVSSQMAKLTIAERFVTFAFQPISVEQGKETDLVVKVTKNADFLGEAQVTLVGLPNKVTAEPLKMTKDTTELVFHLKTDKVSPAGNHNNLLCQAVVTQEGEPILHNLGTGRLRIDVPLPPKPAAPAPAPTPVAAAPAQAPAPAPAPPAEKRLSRLEKLRLEAQERARAGK